MQIKLLVLDSSTWNYLTMYKKISSGSFNYSFANHIYLTCMYKQDLALNNPQVLKCHRIQLIKQLKTHQQYRQLKCALTSWIGNENHQTLIKHYLKAKDTFF